MRKKSKLGGTIIVKIPFVTFTNIAKVCMSYRQSIKQVTAIIIMLKLIYKKGTTWINFTSTVIVQHTFIRNN